MLLYYALNEEICFTIRYQMQWLKSSCSLSLYHLSKILKETCGKISPDKCDMIFNETRIDVTVDKYRSQENLKDNAEFSLQEIFNTFTPKAEWQNASNNMINGANKCYLKKGQTIYIFYFN